MKTFLNQSWDLIVRPILFKIKCAEAKSPKNKNRAAGTVSVKEFDIATI